MTDTLAALAAVTAAAAEALRAAQAAAIDASTFRDEWTTTMIGAINRAPSAMADLDRYLEARGIATVDAAREHGCRLSRAVDDAEYALSLAHAAFDDASYREAWERAAVERAAQAAEWERRQAAAQAAEWLRRPAAVDVLVRKFEDAAILGSIVAVEAKR